jgi:glycosyltransferase involved in cell wall biosynthesis
MKTLWAASDEDALPRPDTATPVPLACWNLIERITGLPMPIPGLSGLRRLRKAIRASDAVVVHDALYVSSIAAMLLARRAGKPVLLIQHIADIPFSSVLLQRVMALANRLVTRPMLRAADRLVFISDTTRRAFAEVKTRAPALLLFNGVDTEVFHPGRERCARRTGDRRGGEAGAVRRALRREEGAGGARARGAGAAGMALRACRTRADRSATLGTGQCDGRRRAIGRVARRAVSRRRPAAAAERRRRLSARRAGGDGVRIAGGVRRRDRAGRSRRGGWLRGVEIALADPDGTARRVLAAVETLDVDADGAAR